MAFVKRTGFIREASPTSVVEDILRRNTKQGDGYNINSGSISLTSSGTSSILYIKYTGTKQLIISDISVGIGASTGSTNPAEITLIRNPTTGTVISDATAAPININKNFSSSNTLSADAYKGAEAKTFTNGDDAGTFFTNEKTNLYTPVYLILNQNNSVGLKITPMQASGNVDVYAAMVCFEEDL
jgi:hypothetical protein